jgi:hypothetical protein
MTFATPMDKRRIMRDIVDENLQRLKQWLKDFWKGLMGEKDRVAAGH